MEPVDDIKRLRQYLDHLADDDDEELARYELTRPPKPPGLYWQVRWLGGRMLRWLEAMGLKKPDPWPVALKQGSESYRAKPLLIWAVGTDRDTLREACLRFPELREALPGLAPVLVTDVADFAFFSRVGCLVEYLPEITGEGQRYEERKLRFLARLYRGAPALPARAVVETTGRLEAIRQLMGDAGVA
jgi:hypothetical protein